MKKKKNKQMTMEDIHEQWGEMRRDTKFQRRVRNLRIQAGEGSVLENALYSEDLGGIDSSTERLHSVMGGCVTSISQEQIHRTFADFAVEPDDPREGEDWKKRKRKR